MNVLDLFRLDGMAAIVTGGSKGLGFAIAEALAQAGADIVMTSRTESEIEAAAEKLAGETGRKIVPLVADVSSGEDVKRLVGTTVETLGKIDIAVNNAGINIRHPALEFPVEDFEKVVDINLHGVFRVSQAVGAKMIEQGSGSIINIASILDTVSIAGRSAYAASKGGVKMLTKSLALEWTEHGVRVNAISPGPFATPLNKPLIEDPVMNEKFLQRVPIGRWGDPSELGPAAVFLASPAAGYITGTTLYVDGGWTTH